MTLRIYFPRWHSQSLLTPKEWAAEYKLEDDRQFFELLALIIKDQGLASSMGRTKFFALCDSIAQDILFLQAPVCSKKYRQNLEYLQFESSLTPLILSLNAGELHTAHDWIINGFSNKIANSIERTFDWPRILDFLSADVAWIKKNRNEHLLEWFGRFFYYCRTRATMYEIARSIVPIAIPLLNSTDCSPEISLETARFILDWCAVYDEHWAVEILASLLLKGFWSSQTSLKSKTRIAISFVSLSRQVGDMHSIDWAKWILRNGRTELEGHEYLHVIVATIINFEEWKVRKKSVLNAIDIYIDHLKVLHRSPAAAVLAIEQRVQLLNPLVWKLQSFGCGTDLLEMLCHWYAVPTQYRRASNVLFVLPSVHEGMTYLGTDRHSIPFLQENSYEALNACTNRSLGTTTTVAGQKEHEKAPDRQGEPAYEFGEAFEQELVRHYQWEKLPQVEVLDARAMLFFPGLSHPNQALLQSLAGHSLPIASSLQEPMQDADIKKAGIWFAGNDFYSEMEANAISAILRAAGIDTEIVSGREKTNEDFLIFYRNSSFDLIWIAGHGICDRWDPLSPAILAGGASVVEIDMLTREVARSCRRLLVLNICDGGTSAVTGGIQKLGLAPMLASRFQATLSHLWPVEPRVASAFGALLAIEIVRSRANFFSAFESAVSMLRTPWAAIVERVAAYNEGELTDRLRNVMPEMNNIFHWGSPCFFE